MKLTRKGFAAWLKKNARKRYETGECYQCALARYLREVRGESVVVWPSVAYSNEWKIALPKWARIFIAKFDDTRELYRTGRQALALL